MAVPWIQCYLTDWSYSVRLGQPSSPMYHAVQVRAPRLGSWATSLRHLLFSHFCFMSLIGPTMSSNNSMQTIHSFIMLSRHQIPEMNPMPFKPVLRHYKHGSIIN